MIDLKRLDEYTALFIDTFSMKHWNGKWKSTDEAKAELMDILKTPGFIGEDIKDNGKIIGAVFGNIVRYCKEHIYNLRFFFIASDYQRKGYGSKLFDKLIRVLKGKEIKTIILMTKKGSLADEFYRKHGFKIERDTIVMVKKL